MANPDPQTTNRAKLVSAARAVVTYQIGFPQGCVRLTRAAAWLRAHEPVDLPAVEAYVAAVRELPIGTERLAWDRVALRQLDVQLEAANRRFRDPVFEACFRIIDELGVGGDVDDS